ncbi:hypothetical protein Taro_051090 [Colocasia esculenta]|uniref:Uncharacterized protein n=1 Tax=Colocasia esculenta TaxID=4460 RepID=A0A843XFX3_COLES|nr:hypothetical protein [Colocasia esculenta]
MSSRKVLLRVGLDLEQFLRMLGVRDMDIEAPPENIADRNKTNQSHQSMPYKKGRKSHYQLKDDFVSFLLI